MIKLSEPHRKRVKELYKWRYLRNYSVRFGYISALLIGGRLPSADFSILDRYSGLLQNKHLGRY